jgi:hypothetical protein
MIPPIKYSDIYLYSTSDEVSVDFKVYLDSNNIKYTNLFYDLEHKNDSLDALSTWFLDPANEGSNIKFTKLPILIFEEIFWESPDKLEVYQKRWFARTMQEIPSDFSTISVKI